MQISFSSRHEKTAWCLTKNKIKLRKNLLLFAKSGMWRALMIEHVVMHYNKCHAWSWSRQNHHHGLPCQPQHLSPKLYVHMEPCLVALDGWWYGDQVHGVVGLCILHLVDGFWLFRLLEAGRGLLKRFPRFPLFPRTYVFGRSYCDSLWSSFCQTIWDCGSVVHVVFSYPWVSQKHWKPATFELDDWRRATLIQCATWLCRCVLPLP